MNTFDMFAFESSPWEQALDELTPGGVLTAGHFLALMEGEGEDAHEDAFLALAERGVLLDLTDLPKAAGTGEAALRLRQEEQLAASGDLLTGLEENDPLRLYFEELASIPACGDPVVLALEVAEGNESARERLVNVSLSRVVELAKEFVGRGVLLLDLIQEGSMGLWQGILEYNGGDFDTHRDWWIRFYMVKTVVEQARSCGVGQKMRQALEDYRSVDERLVSELGRNPTLEEIAEELHMTAEEAGSLSQMVSAARRLAQFRPEETPEEEEQAEDRQAVENTAYFQTRQRIAEMLSSLAEEEAKLLSLRFGLEGGLPMTPEEAGRKLGLTPEEVVTREAAALAKLRQG